MVYRPRSRHSPAQVAARLHVDFPDDPEMLVSRIVGMVHISERPPEVADRAIHTAETVAAAMIVAVPRIPEVLRGSMTWDHGCEMAHHARITAATGLPIYFCDPHCPWQRGTSENTNGLQRQHFPTGADLSFWGP